MEKPFSAYQGGDRYVFVCYAHGDADSVYPEIAWLNDYGVNVWYDEGISPGHEWREELATAIQGCERVLFFVSPNSVDSEHCRRELNFAQEENRQVVAIHLEPTEVPAGLRLGLNNRQAIFKHELSDEEYRKRLIRAANAGAMPASEATLPPPTSSSRRGLVPAAVVLAVGIVAAAIWWSSAQEPSPVDAETVAELEPDEPTSREVLHNSIAVLPFDNLSLDPENGFFAAGIHEEVLNQLTKIKDLSVIARTTMLRYAETDKTVPEIGVELNVGAVMEGSVRYAGDRVRITAQLIDAASGAHLWSEAYEENLEDIFGIQLAIATKIAKTLEAEFTPSEQTRIATRLTDNPVAYAHYLRAVSSWGNYAPTGPMHEAIDAAIALDPQFGSAFAFKAFLHAIEAIAGPAFAGPDFDVNDQRRFASLARDYALRALAIDSAQARAHWSLGWTHTLNREWEASQQSFERAYELDPNDYIVLNGAAWASLNRGDIDIGIQRMARSVALNPGDFANQGNYLGFLVWCERWEDAKRQAGIMTTLAPAASVPFDILAEVASFLGDSEGVRTNAAMAEERSDLPSPGLANAYRRIGDEANARRIFDASNVDASNVPDNPKTYNSLTKTVMYMAIEEHEVALEHLEHAVDDGFLWAVARDLHYLSHHPRFDPLRPYPKFQELVRKAGLPLDHE